jgi:hypothetical protein
MTPPVAAAVMRARENAQGVNSIAVVAFSVVVEGVVS